MFSQTLGVFSMYHPGGYQSMTTDETLCVKEWMMLKVKRDEIFLSVEM
jgi:hypothetical protein